MIKISFNNKEYFIDKEKLKFILEKLNGSKVSDDEVLNLMKKFCLYDECFLEKLNKI